MELERVIDVLAKEKPDKILIYIRDNLLFNDTVRNFFSYSRYNRYLEKLNVYCYEHINNESNTILIRVIE
jgi:hypothetical protein